MLNSGFTGEQEVQFRNAKEALRDELGFPQTGNALTDERYISAVITAVLLNFGYEDLPGEALFNLENETTDFLELFAEEQQEIK